MNKKIIVFGVIGLALVAVIVANVIVRNRNVTLQGITAPPEYESEVEESEDIESEISQVETTQTVTPTVSKEAEEVVHETSSEVESSEEAHGNQEVEMFTPTEEEMQQMQEGVNEVGDATQPYLEEEIEDLAKNENYILDAYLALCNRHPELYQDEVTSVTRYHAPLTDYNLIVFVFKDSVNDYTMREVVKSDGTYRYNVFDISEDENASVLEDKNMKKVQELDSYDESLQMINEGTYTG